VPPIIIGGWQLTERYGRDKAIETLLMYAEANFTTFDTADIYGQSEAILGEFRKKYIAKYGEEQGSKLEFYTKYVTQDATLAEARRVNVQSRSALGATPHVVQFHWWNFRDERYVSTAGHLAALQSEGALRHVAACNYDTKHLKALVDADLPITVNQVQYSLLDRRPENGLIEYAQHQGIQLTCFGAVAGGWLSDKFLGVSEQEASRLAQQAATVSMRMYKSSLDAWTGGDWNLFQKLLRALREIADSHRCTVATVAIAWVTSRLEATCGGGVILGVRDTRHLSDAVTARDLRLSAPQMAAIQQVLVTGKPPDGDIWSRERRL